MSSNKNKTTKPKPKLTKTKTSSMGRGHWLFLTLENVLFAEVWKVGDTDGFWTAYVTKDFGDNYFEAYALVQLEKKLNKHYVDFCHGENSSITSNNQ